MRALIVADSDTRWKWASAIANGLGADESVSTRCLLDTRSMPSDRQLEELGSFGGVTVSAEVDEVVESGVAFGHDVVILGVTGGRIFRITHAFRRAVESAVHSRRPIVVTGYVGVVYEKHLDGFLLRVGADLICVNSEKDRELFASYCDALGIDPAPLVRTGFPMIRERRPLTPRAVRTLTFVVQPSVPASVEERRHALERLLAYARRYPDRRVIVKLRARPGEETTHPERFHYERVLAAMKTDVPPNFETAYGLMSDVLAETDLCVTVSSTAALEALALGIPTAILTDFGVKESLGNHYFVDSGCLVSFADLLADRIPSARGAWLERNGLSTQDSVENLRFAVKELVERNNTSPGGLPLQPQWYDHSRAPLALSTLTGPDSPAVREGSLGRLRASLRRGVRRVLQGPLYRVYRQLARWAGAG